ncbi:MAG: nucleotide exchange factor GrpE [Erysipelotrichaceae bacterium]|nr:nucleotide exchange factor GrpE [Erysipelotrichaceae bacterium]
MEKEKETVTEEEVSEVSENEEKAVEDTAEEVIQEDMETEEEIVEDINEESETDLLKKEIEKLKNDYARAYADTENMKKRLMNEAEQTKKYRIQSFAKEIVPVLDNLERALKVEANESNQSLLKGVEMVYNQLINALKQEGVEEIDCLNKPFDANFHQAIMMEKVEGTDAGIVIEVLQKGYMLKDRILRPAMVKVSE